MNIYVIRGGKTYGPYTEPTVRQFMNQGQFAPNDLARSEEGEDWEELSKVLLQQGVKRTQTAKPPNKGILLSPRFRSMQMVLDSVKRNFAAGVLMSTVSIVVALTVYKYFNLAPKVELILHPKKPQTGVVRLLQDELAGRVVVTTNNGYKFSIDSAQVSVYPLETVRAQLLEKSLVCQSEIARLKPLLDAAKLERDNNCEIYLNLISHNPSGSLSGSEQALEAQAAYDKSSAKYFKLDADMKKYVSGIFYFQNLPPTSLKATTDSRGSFSIQLPSNGDYILTVVGGRRSEGVVETYYWILPVHMDESFKPLELNEKNTVPFSPPVLK